MQSFYRQAASAITISFIHCYLFCIFCTFVKSSKILIFFRLILEFPSCKNPCCFLTSLPLVFTEKLDLTGVTGVTLFFLHSSKLLLESSYAPSHPTNNSSDE